MQIDLLSTRKGEIGLLGDAAFETPISAVIFDVDARSLTLEFAQTQDSVRMNVPVGEDFVERLKIASFMHICIVEKGRMVQAFQAPLMKVSSVDEDFYYYDYPRGITFVQNWVESVREGQPIHRDQLGVESSARGVIPELTQVSLNVAPQLAQVLAQEQAMVRQQKAQFTPQMAPPSLGPGSKMMGMNMNQNGPKAPSGSSDEG